MFPVVSLFRLRVSHYLDRATFPAPSTSNAACGFPALRSPICFTPGLWDLSCWGDFRPVASHSIGVEQPSSVVQPPPIPPFPAEALSFLSKSPETPGRFSLRLDVYPPPQVLQINGRLCHLVLAFPYVGDVANGRAPSLHGHYSASSLLRTQSATLSSSADFPVSPVIRPTLLRRFRAGTRRASPVAQHVLVTVLSLPPRRGDHPYRSVFGCSCCLRPTVAGSALGDTHFRGHNAYRGRDGHYWPPPAQIRTRPTKASGSYLGCLTSKRSSGQG